MAIDEAKLNELVGRFVDDLGATGHAANMVIGDRLGLYRALADEHSPAFLPDGAEFALGVLRATPAITDASRTGQRLGWHEHHRLRLSRAVDRAGPQGRRRRRGRRPGPLPGHPGHQLPGRQLPPGHGVGRPPRPG